jgi:hypothetical protein
MKSSPTVPNETAAGHPLRLESMMSASSLSSNTSNGSSGTGNDGPSRISGRGGGSATTSPTFSRMVTSDSNNTLYSTASSSSLQTSGSVASFEGPHIGSVTSTSGPPPPLPAATQGAQASPIWPHSTVFSPNLSDCLCNAALFSSHSAAGHANFAPPHSYRCRYGAFTRGDLDIMIDWLDARLLGGSYMSDVDRLRFEWLRAFLSLSFYLWAL